MKILISSVHPTIGSGYGMITKYLLDMFTQMSEVEVKVIAYYGAKFKTEYKGIEILPNWGSGFIGEESILAECKSWKPDVLLTTYDIFILAPTFFKQIKQEGVKIASMLMVDSSPFQVCNIPTLHEVDYPICVTEWALSQIPKDIAKKATYIPLAINTSYYIKDKHKSKIRFNELIGGNVLNNDTKLTTIVSANCGDDRSRKGFYPMLKGWKKHLEQTDCKNKYLYIHSDVRGLAQGGTDLKLMMMTLKYTAEQASTIIFPLQMKYLTNEFSVDDMADIYNASDFYLSAAQAEGFGMPIIESIACGCYPIVTDFGASKELINKTQDNPEQHLLEGSDIYVGNNAVRCHVTEDTVAKALTNVYTNNVLHNKLEAATKCKIEYGQIKQMELWSQLINKIGKES